MRKSLYAMVLLSFMAVFAANAQDYYLSKTINGNYKEVVQKTKDVLKEQGFGVTTETQMDKVLKEKLDNVDMKPYLILGVCNPGFAYKTLRAEPNIGLFLPCKVVVKQVDDSKVEVVMINPSEVMKNINNPELDKVAAEVTKRFKEALSNL
ncbi:DUF302 domain-containing protein [Saccharicrinis sp. FJH2]|uniref:DUF302 domain-containing protein n=1 Tax=Saccharicrinis sp. FJH65 TaxID=3344659 RepID=UPI0035F47AA6